MVAYFALDAWKQRTVAVKQRTEAEDRQLIAVANNQLDQGGLQRALLLFAASGYGGSRTKDAAQQSLQRALAVQPQFRMFLSSHQSEVYSVAFSPNGETLASAHFDGTVILWDVMLGDVAVDMASLLKKACTIANRDLTPAEWQQYVGDLK